jgi:mono/diheme cytochrome c family protein
VSNRAGIAILGLLLGLAEPALAGGANDEVATGRQLAEQLCARCHAIAGPGPGPLAQAPAFSGFARKWPIDYLAESLAEGIVTGHGPVRMPAFKLEPPAIDALLAYLKSVQG